MNRLKKYFFFLSPFFIFLIHLLFVFAKTRPGNKSVFTVSADSKTLTGVHGANTEKLPNSNKPDVYDSLKLSSTGLSKQAFDYAIKGLNFLRTGGKLASDTIVSIIDFTMSSGKKRLFVIDIKNYKVLYNTYVAHG